MADINLSAVDNAADILKTVLGSGGTNGLTIADVRARTKMIDKLESPETVEAGFLTVTAEEHAIVRAAFDSFRWGAVHSDIIKLDAAIGA